MRWTFLFFLFATSIYGSISYEVEYLGVKDPQILKVIKSIAELSTLQKKPPESLQSLRYRAESDLPEILKVLQSYGYYEATLDVKLEHSQNETYVFVLISLGPRYRLKTFSIQVDGIPHFEDGLLETLLDKPIIAEQILEVKEHILQKLSFEGFPFASVDFEEMVADGDTKTVTIYLHIDPGTLTHFGPTTIKGTTSVKSSFITQKMEWREDEPYSSDKIDQTQKNLMDTGLFSSVLINPSPTPSPDGVLPVEIEISEAKHRSIYGGISYQTYYGPGLTFGWEHRNLNGVGRKLSTRGDVTWKSHSGVINYLIPNFFKEDQDYVWEAQAMRLNILPYSERSYTLTNRFEKRFNNKMRVAFGALGERVLIRNSALNGHYSLFEIPIFFACNASNNLLNPTKGFNLEYKATPSIILSNGKRAYIMNQFSFAHYILISPAVSFAQHLSGGFFFCGNQLSVPIVKKFFGGSEETFRGYAYYSVSPLNQDLAPIGGRSAIYYTFETRFRLVRNFGLVSFFDTGNVSQKKFMTLEGKWLKSVGVGLRYFSFVGPFRIDVGFPLNRREGIDKKYRILVSIGQTF